MFSSVTRYLTVFDTLSNLRFILPFVRFIIFVILVIFLLSGSFLLFSFSKAFFIMLTLFISCRIIVNKCNASSNLSYLSFDLADPGSDGCCGDGDCNLLSGVFGAAIYYSNSLYIYNNILRPTYYTSADFPRITLVGLNLLTTNPNSGEENTHKYTKWLSTSQAISPAISISCAATPYPQPPTSGSI